MDASCCRAGQLRITGSAARMLGLLRALSSAFLAVLAISAARADDTTNSANNPLTAETSVNLQNYYTPSFYGQVNSDANSLLLRGLVPLNTGGVQQLIRFTLPYSVNPSPEGYADGLERAAFG
jgi:hypothetical protein